MNGVDNAGDLPFNCLICLESGYRGQLGEHSLVETSCPASHVLHLGCITRWLDEQNEKGLDQRECVCREPALPLIRMDGMRSLEDDSLYCETRIFNACRTGNLRSLKMLLREGEALANRTYHSVTTGHPEHLLAVAIKEGHTELVRFLINNDADVNAVEYDGQSPLYIAARLHRNEDFEMLIRHNANIDNALSTSVQEGNAEVLEYLISTQPSQPAINNILREAAEQGQTQCLILLIKAGATDLNGALSIAAERGQTKCLKTLIKAGANELNNALRIAVLSEYIEGRSILEQHGGNIITVLHTAAREGSRECLNYLINPTSINTTDEKGQTPLHMCAANGHSKCLEMLLEVKGVNVNATDDRGETALHLAVHNSHVKCLRQLMQKGAKVNVTNKDGATALHIATRIGNNVIKKGNSAECLKELIAKRGVNINVTDNNGITPLMIAARWGKFERLTCLLKAGADINASMDDGTTSLHLAAACGHTEIVKALLRANDIKVNEKDAFGRSALHMAAHNGRTETVKMLLAADVVIKVNEKDATGWTALHMAAHNGHTETVKTLLAADVVINVNEKDATGRTALHIAAFEGHTEIVKALLVVDGIWVNEKDATGRTALHMAALNGHTEIVKRLLAADVVIKVNEKDATGMTALHIAAFNGHTEIVKALIDVDGIWLNEKQNNGKTALDLAHKSGCRECVKLLNEKGAKSSWACLIQ